jgi:hypothetical protein
MCFNFLYNFYLKYFSFWKKFIEMLLHMWKCDYVKCPLFLSDFNETLIFSTETQILNFIKSHPVVPYCSIRTDGRADMTKLIVAFRNFAKARKNFTLNTLSTYVY